jgi:hypothetical protein
MGGGGGVHREALPEYGGFTKESEERRVVHAILAACQPLSELNSTPPARRSLPTTANTTRRPIERESGAMVPSGWMWVWRQGTERGGHAGACVHAGPENDAACRYTWVSHGSLSFKVAAMTGFRTTCESPFAKAC